MKASRRLVKQVLGVKEEEFIHIAYLTKCHDCFKEDLTFELAQRHVTERLWKAACTQQEFTAEEVTMFKRYISQHGVPLIRTAGGLE